MSQKSSHNSEDMVLLVYYLIVQPTKQSGLSILKKNMLAAKLQLLCF